MSSPEPESSPQPEATAEGGDARLQDFRARLSDIKRYAEIDTRDDFATLSGVREINNGLTEPPPPYSADNTDAQTNINEDLLEIQSRERYDQMDRLASLRDMTQVEQLTESSVPAADDRQARIAAKTTELRQRWQVERDVHEANAAGREAQEADDIGLSHSLWRPDY
jgi:hypothetical protein